MGKGVYEQNMKLRIQDLGFAIDGIRRKLDDGVDDRMRVELAGELSELEARRERMEQKLDTLEAQPASAWNNLKAEIEQEWNDLVQDFEERLGGY